MCWFWPFIFRESRTPFEGTKVDLVMEEEEEEEEMEEEEEEEEEENTSIIVRAMRLIFHFTQRQGLIHIYISTNTLFSEWHRRFVTCNKQSLHHKKRNETCVKMNLAHWICCRLKSIQIALNKTKQKNTQEDSETLIMAKIRPNTAEKFTSVISVVIDWINETHSFKNIQLSVYCRVSILINQHILHRIRQSLVTSMTQNI